ncbi:BET1L protein, partial [Polypterus senegalus]
MKCDDHIVQRKKRKKKKTESCKPGRQTAAVTQRPVHCPPMTAKPLASTLWWLTTQETQIGSPDASLSLILAQLALDIDKETEEHNAYLDGMDSNFLSATGLLTGSVKRFSNMVRSGRDNRRLLCYVSVGLILLFFVLYFIVSRAQT